MNSTTTAGPAFDANTTSAIQQALGLARAGRLNDACVAAERALAAGGDKVGLNALIGMLRMDMGENKVAIRHLEIAHAARPADMRIATNFATALANAEQLDRVLEVASSDLAFSDPSLQLARIRGYAAQMSGRAEEAVAAYEHVVSAVPNDWESHNNLGNARLLAGDVDGAVEELEKAVALAPDSAPPRINLARSYRLTGEFGEAEGVLRKMTEDFPDDPQPWLDLHDLLKDQSRTDEILPVLDGALKLRPDDLELLLARGRHFGTMLEMDKAEAVFRDVLVRDPANGDAFVGLATVYEHSKATELEGLVEEAERRKIEQNALNLVRAFAHRRAKRFEEGSAALAQVDPDFEAPRRQHLIGQMLEGLKDYDGAFAAFERMNELQATDPSGPVQRAALLREQLRDQLAKTNRTWFESWTSPPVDASRRQPVFLVGFPRSGTTLLDTIMMGHPDTVVMEERPVISRLEQELGGFDAIARLDEPAIRNAQRRYFEIAAEYVDVDAAPLLVDKAPLLLNQAAFIHRLFPSAHFMLALRHPADVLLSCFVSNFNLNSAMANFLSLETAAEFYDLTFRSWENARSILPLNVHPVVYEKMVEDPAAVLRPVVEALGLKWHEDMLDHTKTAAERGLITTASYAQVTEPLYKRSVGRWHRYRKQLEPVLPLLAPWAEKFGYTI